MVFLYPISNLTFLFKAINDLNLAISVAVFSLIIKFKLAVLLIAESPLIFIFPEETNPSILSIGFSCQSNIVIFIVFSLI